MKLCIRPFGIGVEDVDTAVVKDKAVQLGARVAEQAKWTGLVAVGLGLVVAEVVTRRTADGLFIVSENIRAAGNKVLDAHDDYIVPAIKYNADDKIDHAYKLVDEAEKYANGAGTVAIA